MKNKIIAVLLAFAFLLSFAKPYKLRASADGMTAAMMGSIAYGIMQSAGITFTAGSATGAGMESFMAGQIESYVNSQGGSITSVFGGEMARLAAGKLVVGQQMYNGVLGFVDWLRDKYSLSSSDFALTDGKYEEYFLPYEGEGGESINGEGIEVLFTGKKVDASFTDYGDYYGVAQVYNNGSLLTSITSSGNAYGFLPFFELRAGQYSVQLYIEEFRSSTSQAPYHYGWKYANVASHSGAYSDSLSWSVPEDWSAPAPLPQDKQWEGDFSQTPGWAEPQDLPDFLSRVPTAIAENNLVVQEEITDTGGTPPTPSPNTSPSPSPAPYPGLSIAEKIALILGEITGIIFDTKGDTADQTYQDIGQEIEQTTQEIAESITEPITQTQTQTQQQIIDSTQTITDTITDTQTQTQEKLEDITQTIEDATTVPDQTSWDKVKKDLHGVFPFCIPWDIYGMLNAFNAEPRAPYFEYPFKIPSINLDYTLELDFKDFDPVAQTLRTVELIAFCVGLAILTSKVIRW